MVGLARPRMARMCRRSGVPVTGLTKGLTHNIDVCAEHNHHGIRLQGSPRCDSCVCLTLSDFLRVVLENLASIRLSVDPYHSFTEAWAGSDRRWRLFLLISISGAVLALPNRLPPPSTSFSSLSLHSTGSFICLRLHLHLRQHPLPTSSPSSTLL